MYETVTQAQNDSLKWLVGELRATLRVAFSEVFRHPTVSRRNPTEASMCSFIDFRTED